MKVPPGPMMNAEEVEAVRKVLTSKRPKRVLEWGAGGSTLYWPTQFTNIEWVTVEHDKGWADAVRAGLPPNVRLLHLPFPDYWRLEEGDFDLIIVDGRERVRCLDAARGYIRPGGAVLLHDASRKRYTPGLDYWQEREWLVPPTSSKDPRGLMILREPTPAMAIPRPTRGTTGAMYICWGTPASIQAANSIVTLRQHMPDLPIVVVGDRDAVDYFKGPSGVTVLTPDVNPFSNQSLFGFLAGRVKPLLAGLSPFERTMYVDADTEFKTTPQLGYDLLDRWDFVIAEAETRSLAVTFPDNRTEAGETAAKFGTGDLLYHNSGLFWWRAGEPTSRLFQVWGDEWHRYQGWDEQIALLRALLISDAVWLNVPYTWNCRGPNEAFMVYHRFAGRSARKFGGPAIQVVPHTRGVPMKPSRPLVRVEVSPGRFIRVLQGDEERAAEAFRQTHQARIGRSK